MVVKVSPTSATLTVGAGWSSQALHLVHATGILENQLPKGVLRTSELVSRPRTWLGLVSARDTSLHSYPPTAYSLFPMAATPTLALRVDMEATMCQRSVRVS